MIATRVKSDEPGTLTIRATGSTGVRVTFHDGHLRTDGTLALPPGELLSLTSWASSLGNRFFDAGTSADTVRRHGERLADSLLPANIRAAIERWQSGRHSVLVVEADRRLVDLPWELLSATFRSGLFVVRIAARRDRGGARAPGLRLPARVAAAGWEQMPGGAVLPGILAELDGLQFELGSDDISVDAFVNAPFSDLTDRIAAPDVLHLSIASGFKYEQGPNGSRTELTLFPDRLAEQTFDDDLIRVVSEHESIRLVVLNTMPNPVTAAVPMLRQLCAQTGAAVVGWTGGLQDPIAVDFALFWYQRALDGLTIAEISSSFTAQYGDRQWVAGAIPMVWIPNVQWLRQPVFDTDRYESSGPLSDTGADGLETTPPISMTPGSIPQPGTMPFPAGYPSTPTAPNWTPLDVKIDVELLDSLFPALLVNGHRPLKKLSIDTNQDFSGFLQIDCDTGSGFSTFRLARRFLAGRNTIVPGTSNDDIDFPAIYELIASNERRVISITISVYTPDALVAQTTKTVPWLTRRDWLNDDTGWPFVPAHVLSMSPAVAELVNRAQDILIEIGQPSDRFKGYPELQNATAAAEQVRLQVRAIFQAVRSLGVRYIVPPGLPPNVFNPARMHPDVDPVQPVTATPTDADRPVGGQLVRTPTDVLDRRHGTCHDLALMFAAALEYIGLYPLVVLMPGHTYFGYWVDRQSHRTHWQTATRPAWAWTIPGDQLATLVAAGAIDVVEPNYAGHLQGTFERARILAATYAGPDNQVVDIHESRRHNVQPVTLG